MQCTVEFLPLCISEAQCDKMQPQEDLHIDIICCNQSLWLSGASMTMFWH